MRVIPLKMRLVGEEIADSAPVTKTVGVVKSATNSALNFAGFCSWSAGRLLSPMARKVRARYNTYRKDIDHK